MMNETILHSDLNCFYAAAEMNENPSLKGLRMAVCGSVEDRHGIVLAKSYSAKAMGVKTGMAIWQAKQACPDLVCVPPHYDLYQRYSHRVREIYADYSDAIEPFGMDECWIALPVRDGDCARGQRVAEEIRRRVKEECGLTVSVGVSFNKIFAKLGSDLKKPDAVTVVSPQNFRSVVWPLPVSDLLYVGPATTRRLSAINVHTIGDLARCDPETLRARLGKNGVMLWRFASGMDASPVMPEGYEPPILSVGHGSTCVRDLEDAREVWRVLYQLSQDVGHRLRAQSLLAQGVQLSVRDRDLCFQDYQSPLPLPTRAPLAIARHAFHLFQTHYEWEKPVRALTVRGIRLACDSVPVQTDVFDDERRAERLQRLSDAVDEIRGRFGEDSVRAASLLGRLHMAQDHCETVTMPGMMYR